MSCIVSCLLAVTVLILSCASYILQVRGRSRWQCGMREAMLALAPQSAATGNSTGFTPCHGAAHVGHTAVLDLLFKADPACAAAREKYGDTPAHYAAWQGRPAALQRILQVAPQTAVAVNVMVSWAQVHDWLCSACTATALAQPAFNLQSNRSSTLFPLRCSTGPDAPGRCRGERP